MNEMDSTNGKGTFLEKSGLEEPAREARERLRELDHRTREMVRQRPLAALGVALACGYVAARLIGGRSRRTAAPFLGAAAGVAGRVALAALAERAVHRVARPGRNSYER